MGDKIRAATADDLPLIERLFEELDGLHCERLPARFQAAHRPRSQEHLLGLLVEPSAILIADDVGFVQLTVEQSPPVPLFVPRITGTIQGLVVSANARRRGIGRALLEAADAWARARGATSLELTVYAVASEARAFYRSLGFTDLSFRLTR